MNISKVLLTTLTLALAAACVEKTKTSGNLTSKNKNTADETLGSEAKVQFDKPYIQTDEVVSHYVKSDSFFSGSVDKRSLFARGKKASPNQGAETMMLLDLTVENFRAQRYLQKIVDELQDNGWPGLRQKYRVVLWNESSYNARASVEGGESLIFVNTGVLMQPNLSESELAGLLAHEMAHHYLGHQRRGAMSNFVKDSAVKATLFLTDISNASDEANNVEVSEAEKQKRVAKSQANLILISRLTSALVNAPWSRKQEYDADRLAMDLIVTSGYSYRGIDSYLSRFADPEASGEKFVNDVLGIGTETLADLKKVHVDKDGVTASGGGSGILSSDGKIDKVKLSMGLSVASLKFLVRASDELHARPNERSKEINLYLGSVPDYKGFKKSKKHRQINESGIDEMIGGTTVQHWTTELSDLSDAWIEYSANQQDLKALDTIEKLSANEKDTVGNYIELILVLEKKIDGSLADVVNDIGNWGGKYPYVYNDIASRLMDAGHTDLAYTVITQAKGNIGLPALWPSLYRYYLLTNDTKLAQDTLKQCILDGNIDAQTVCIYLAPEEQLNEVENFTIDYVDLFEKSVDNLSNSLR